MVESGTRDLGDIIPRARMLSDQIKELEREIRTLKYQKKELGKASGKQGARIYELRNEVAALRQALTVDPSAYRNLLANLRETRRENAALYEEVRELKNRLASDD